MDNKFEVYVIEYFINLSLVYNITITLQPRVGQSIFMNVLVEFGIKRNIDFK